MNHYDVEQEKKLVNDKDIKIVLDNLSFSKEITFFFHVIHVKNELGKVFLYIQSSSSQDDTFDYILQFIYKLLLEMKRIGELSDILSDLDLEILSGEINELILQK